MQLTSRTHRTVETDLTSGHGFRSPHSPLTTINTNDDTTTVSNIHQNHHHHHHHGTPMTMFPLNREEEHNNSKSHRRPSPKTTKSSSTQLWLFFRRMKHQWVLLSGGSKVGTMLMLLVLSQYLIFGIWDQFFSRLGIDHPMTVTTDSSTTETYFAVAINTYKRPDMLRQAVQHYADTCGRKVGISQVFVIWAEQHSELPSSQSFFEHPSNTLRSNNDHNVLETSSNRATIEVLQKSKDSLNSRFEPIPSLESTAVFMVDDDLRVSCSSLWQAFQAWKNYPDSMVGYYPRLALPPRRPSSSSSSSSELVYHTWPVVFWTQSYNFVLTKASFLHAKYLELYTHHFLQEIKDYVDQHMNCEDIAMSMLVANYTQYSTSSTQTTSTTTMPAPPIYVEGSVSDKGLLGGISTGTGHMTTRSDCLTALTRILQKHGWKPPLDYHVSLRPYGWVRHAPGFWWQYRPSNVFEWFALANTFT